VSVRERKKMERKRQESQGAEKTNQKNKSQASLGNERRKKGESSMG
jgi:hypothetical protein